MLSIVPNNGGEPSNMASNEENKRLYYIDWLRVLVVLALIPFHASLTYLRYGIVYIKAPVSGLAALPFLIIEVPLGDFFMTLMFFVSGVASFYSFKSRGTRTYIGDRAQKLMLSFGLGYFLLCPVTAYIQALYEGFQGGFISFLLYFFGMIPSITTVTVICGSFFICSFSL